MIALTGGIVVAVGLFDILPESLEALDDPQAVAALVGAGFLGWFLIERLLVLHHRDAPEEARAHEQVGTLGALGLSIHSFIDDPGSGSRSGSTRRPACWSSSRSPPTTSPTGSTR